MASVVSETKNETVVIDDFIGVPVSADWDRTDRPEHTAPVAFVSLPDGLAPAEQVVETGAVDVSTMPNGLCITVR